MKKILLLFLMTFIVPVVSAQDCDDCIINSQGVTIPLSQYNAFLEIGFSEFELNNMPQETYDTYGEIDIVDGVTETKYFRETKVNSFTKSYTIVEEISKHEYETEAPINRDIIIKHLGISTYGTQVTDSHETTYKKLIASLLKTSTANPAKRSVIAALDWKKVPSTKSYDIFASRVTNGLISLNSQSGTMSVESYEFGENCEMGGTHTSTMNYPYGVNAWNVQESGIAYSGVGFTGKLSTVTNTCTNDAGMIVSPIKGYNATLTYNAAASTPSGQLTVYISYQHAQTAVNFNTVSQAYTFSNSGLGNVVYFSNSTIRSYYDGMGGVSLTL